MDDAAKRKWKRLLVGELSVNRLVKSLAFIYGSLAAFGYFASDRLLFQPHAASYAPGADVEMLDAGGGTHIAVRYLQTPGAPYTILFSHGNGEDLGDVEPLLDQLRGMNLSVLAYDYEGYGLSEGAPSEKRLYADIDTAYRYLTERRGIPPRAIIAYGRSLGGGPATDLASREPLGGLVLESTFTSVFRVITRVPLFPGDKFQNLAKLRRVRCPVLVMHGRRDRLIPFHHGKALFDAVPGPKRRLWVDDADHGDVPIVAEAAYREAIHDFLDLAMRERR